MLGNRIFARASGFELRRLFHQPELPADVGLNVIGGQAAVGLDDQFFSAEEFQDRFSLGAVVLQTLTQSVFVVVTADDQFPAADIACFEVGRSVMNQVVIEAALATESPC